MNKPVILIGNGGHAAVLAEILIESGREIIGFTAPEKQQNRYCIPYIGTDEAIKTYSSKKIELVLGLGSVTVSNIRMDIFNEFNQEGFTFTSVIHKSAIISPYANLGEGVQIMAGVILQSFAKIADNTIINTASSIDHDCFIGGHCHIAPGVTFSGGVNIGDSTHIGTGTTVIQNVRIGSHVLIGAGSLVLNDIRDHCKAFGVPTKEV